MLFARGGDGLRREAKSMAAGDLSQRPVLMLRPSMERVVDVGRAESRSSSERLGEGPNRRLPLSKSPIVRWITSMVHDMYSIASHVSSALPVPCKVAEKRKSFTDVEAPAYVPRSPA